MELVFKITENKLYAVENLCKLMDVVGKHFSSTCPKDYKKVLNDIINIKNTIRNKKDKFALLNIIEKKI